MHVASFSVSLKKNFVKENSAMDVRILVIFVLPSIVESRWLIQCDEEFEGKTRKVSMAYQRLELYKARQPDVNETFLQNSIITCREFDAYAYNPKYQELLKIQGTNISSPSELLETVHITSLRLNKLHVRVIFPEAFRNMPTLKYMELTHNELTSVSGGVFSSLHKVLTLDLSSNQIRSIEEFDLKGLDRLEKLLLRTNQISQIKQKIFQDVQSLRRLDLTDNQIRTIEDYAFKGCDNLTELFLNENQISEIDEKTFQGIKDLAYLGLIKNQIRTIQDFAFKECDNLKHIYLNGNHLSEISEKTFQGMKSLTRLDLKNNQIRTIEDFSFKECDSLEEILLHENQLSEIGEKTFRDVRNLETLNLAGNQIRTIENFAFKGLDSLRMLWLSDNRISEIGEKTFHGITNLKVLDLAKNKIHKIENFAFKGCNNLRELWLRSNRISQIGENIFQGAKLRILDFSLNSMDKFRLSVDDTRIAFLNLSANGLQTVDFYKFPTCTKVDFSQNRISLITNLEHFEINILNLSNNNLKYINGTISNVYSLTIRQNQLEILDLNFSGPTSLARISLASNHISHLKENTFQGLHRLYSLDLSSNNLSFIQQTLFHDLQNLNSLNLSHNHIERFSFGTFNNLKSLESLDISHNRFLKLDTLNFIPMSLLETLYFENNQIRSLDVRNLTTHFKKLKTVSLTDNLWNCRDLLFIFHHLQQHGVTVLRGDRFDVENFQGVACNVENPEGETTVDMSTGQFPKDGNLKVTRNPSFFNISTTLNGMKLQHKTD